MGTNIYRYAYDPIGNRLAATNNGSGWTYVSNPLNQYTNIADGVILEPEYDADGNMTATGDGWRYVWNGENRMILASNDTTVVTYAYDHQGRMVAKAVNGSPRQYLWDGYNIVRELTHSQTHTLTNWFVWGLDLSGSLQGAGGVGGLLTEIQDGEPYFAAYDANGNVTEYISTNGETEAHYEYSPFGEITAQSGYLVDSFTHRFSTKPWCPFTGLSEYLFRKYSPPLGRWMNRDPIEEMGCSMLYAMAQNAVCDRIDPLGLDAVRVVDGVVYYIRENFLGVDKESHRLGTVDTTGKLHLDQSLRDIFGPVADRITLDMLKGMGSADTFDELVRDVYGELVGRLPELRVSCNDLQFVAGMLDKSASKLGQRQNSKTWNELLAGLSIIGRRGLLMGGLTAEGKKLPKCHQNVIRFLEKSDQLNSNPRAAQHPGGPASWLASREVYMELWREAEIERLEFFSEVLKHEVERRQKVGGCCDDVCSE